MAHNEGKLQFRVDYQGLKDYASINIRDNSPFSDRYFNIVEFPEKLTSGKNLFKLKAVGANTTIELLTRDLILQSGEILKVQAATANRLHVVASIQELSKTRVTTSALARI